MEKKYHGIRRLFGTKGQHNDEVDLSQEKSAQGKETLKSVELSVKRKETIEVRIKANGDSLISSTSTTDPHAHEAKSRQLSHTEISLSKEEIQKIAKELQAANLVLRKRLWRLQYRSTIPAGIILSSIGAASLLFSYLLNSLILTFIGLGAVLWGVLILYITPTKLVRAEVLESLISPMHKSLNGLARLMGYTGEVIFFHPKSLTGLGQGFVFITHYAAPHEEGAEKKIENLNLLPNNIDSAMPPVYLHPKGIFLNAPSQGLVDLFEKELEANFAAKNLSYIQDVLSKLLIEDLKIIEKMALEENGNSINVTITGGPCANICQRVIQENGGTNHMGCPLCSALALVISKVKGSPISISEAVAVDHATVITKYMAINS